MKLVQEFPASDDHGNTVTLRIYQEQKSAGTRADPNAMIPGLKRIETAVGLSVIRLKQGEYEVEQTRQILRSSAPDAP